MSLTARSPVTLLLLLAGCAAVPTERAARIQEANADMVRNCKFVGMVTGSSGLGGAAFRDAALQSAQAEARNRAADRSATHIVWKTLDNSFSSSYVAADAYSCD